MSTPRGAKRPCNLPGEEMEPGLDWDRWLGSAPMREYSSVLSARGVHNHFPSWRNFSEYGGGMTDWGAHHFDIAQWGLGMDQSGPVEIIGTDGELLVNRGVLESKPDDIIKQPIGENETQLYKSPGGGDLTKQFVRYRNIRVKRLEEAKQSQHIFSSRFRQANRLSLSRINRARQSRESTTSAFIQTGTE